LLGNMFGTSGQAAQPSVTTTGSTGEQPAWGADTTVVTAQTSSMVQRGPDSPPAAPAATNDLPWTPATSAPAAAPAKVATAAPASAGGKYKLQVAAVRSRDEAERLAQTLHSYPAVRDGIVSAEIDEAVIGSMGTFYRVRLGPYADASEPGQLCKTLKPQGFDCLVVTQ
jgi:cell division protein FtsN